MGGLGARITLVLLTSHHDASDWVLTNSAGFPYIKSSDSRSTICKLFLFFGIYSTLDALSFHPSHHLHSTHFLEHYKPSLSPYPKQHASPRTSNYSPQVYAYDPIYQLFLQQFFRQDVKPGVSRPEDEGRMASSS
jgi:hypothetical protein